MISQNSLKLMLALTLLGLSGLAFAVKKAVERQLRSENKTSNLIGAEDVSAYSIYIPSPVERTALNRINAMWPKAFSPQYPLTASRLPEFYRRLFETGDRSALGIGAAQMALVRNWSMDANTASIDALKASLLVPVDQLFGDYDPPATPSKNAEPKNVLEVLKWSAPKDAKAEVVCSLFRMERLFRIAQAWPQFQDDVAARYRSCAGADDLLAVWFDINALLFAEDPRPQNSELMDSIGKRLEAIQEKGTPFDAYLAARLSQAAFLKSAHGTSTH